MMRPRRTPGWAISSRLGPPDATGWDDIPGLVNIQKAIENGHL